MTLARSCASAKPFLVALLLAAASVGARAGEGRHAPFSCRLHETHAFLPELQTFSGFRWIACRVGVERVEIEGVAINEGKCEAFDWSAGRTFFQGQTINIPYACLSPVKLAITGNGVTREIRLR
jgi:hypothetical protein